MDSLIVAAAHALAAGDPLGALKHVALRDDPPALALRGIAMAQLGEFARAKTLLRTAARGFGAKEVIARARCIVAEAEIALVSRDLAWPAKALTAAAATLEQHGDRINAAHTRYLTARHHLLTGQLDEAERMLAQLSPDALPPALQATHDLIAAGIAIRHLRIAAARTALDRAAQAAERARIPALAAEVESAKAVLDAPAARRIGNGADERPVSLEDVEALLASPVLVVDACRYAVQGSGKAVSLARRPVLFALARVLAQAYPHDVRREALIAAAFRGKEADESHRARLRVEIGRLRRLLAPFVDVNATAHGYVMAPHGPQEIAVLVPPVDNRHAALLALLADGEAWSSSALALVLGVSLRTIQRSLEALAADGKVQAFGRARARRWMTPPLPGFTTALLLPGPLPGD